AGVLTPVSTLLLIVATRRYEAQLATESLSTDILSLLLFLLVLTSAGARRSVDAFLLRRPGWATGPVRMLYRVVGVPSAGGMRACLIFGFIALSLVNLGGAANHWLDEWWRGGHAMGMIFSSSYMSRVWEWWRAFETSSPIAAGWTSWALTMIQLAMQTTALALIWWRPTSWLVILWGAVYFVSSMLAMQLHYLGAFELLIWIAVFHRSRPTATAQPEPFTRPRSLERALAWSGATFLLVFAAHEAWAFTGTGDYPFPRLRSYIATIGVHAPNVFNENDLRLGDAWCVVYRGEREELLPYHGLQGERLFWLQWNDLLLYRNSVRWRNEFNPATVLDPTRDAVDRLGQLVRFDYGRRGAYQSTYVVDYYSAPASRIALPAAIRFARTYIGTTRFHCSGTGGAATCTPQPAE
ncbi:MAG: hypothetical protein ACRD2A_17270, partial [Vicinamibacterales bacterium]